MDAYYRHYFWFIVLLAVVLIYWTQRYKKTQQGLPPVYFALFQIAMGIFFLYIPYYWGEVGVSGSFSQAGTPGGFISAIGTFFNAVLLTFLEILRHFALALDYNPMKLSDGTEIFYLSQALLWFLAAVGTASVVFLLAHSLLKSSLLKFNRSRPVYYFSNLNEKSFTLASSLYEQAKNKKKSQRPFLVFCQVDVGDESNTEIQFSAEAEEIGAIFEKDPVYALKLKDPMHQQVRIFLMDENEDSNILSLLRMEGAVCPIVPDKHHQDSDPSGPISDIYVFSTHESTELIFDQTVDRFKSVVEESKKAAEKNPGTPVFRYRYNLHLIDETKLIVQKLLLEHPLYEPLFYVDPQEPGAAVNPDADRHDQISVLAIGGGLLGTELVRAAMICGIADNYKFQIQVIDQNAKALEKQFRCFSPYKNCFLSPEERAAGENGSNQLPLPDIFNGDDGIGTSIKPVFHEADCRSTDFDDILETHCRHSNYIVIATGDDELNISTARYLQRWYARQDIMRGMIPSRPPMIFAAIRNSERYEALHRLEEESAVQSKQPTLAGSPESEDLKKTKQLFLFGNNKDIFSADGILNRPLDASAALFNNCYEYDKGDKLQLNNLCTPMEERQQMLDSMYTLSQVMRFSNQMVAMHSLYKMQDLLFSCAMPKLLLEYRYNKNRSYSDSTRLFCTMAKQIRSCGEKLYRLEHRRWNLFYLLDGWECFPLEMIIPCLNSGYTPKPKKPHQHPLIKLHGCLVPYDDLDRLGAICNQDFKGYDACMCTASIFAWLDLEAEPDHATEIRKTLLAAAKAKWNGATFLCSCDELLDLIVDAFDPVQ